MILKLTLSNRDQEPNETDVLLKALKLAQELDADLMHFEIQPKAHLI